MVDVLDQLDDAFLPHGDNFVRLQVAVSEIRSKLGAWQARHPGGPRNELGPVKAYGIHPIRLIRQVTASIPDQIVPESVAGLEFIRDEALRTDPRADMASAEELLHAGQWKAAMVIAGSVTEALLLHTLLDHEGQNAVRKIAKEEGVRRPDNIDEWHLPDYVKVASRLGVLSDGCAEQAKIAQDYRNLIHPGREKRKERKASQGTAWCSVAALHLVVEELAAWWSKRQ